MKNYKKSFIIYNLLLVGTVLLAMNIVIFMYSYHSGIEELKTTMQQKIEPYDTIRNILRGRPESSTPPQNDSAPPENNGTPPEPKGGKRPPDMPGKDDKKYSKSVYVFFYNTETKNVSVISKDELQENESLVQTAESICAAKEDFGVLKSENLYYYKQQAGNEIKIAAASRSSIRLEMLELFSVLLLIFVFSMAAFYFISRRLAERAAKPLEDAIAREKQFITDASHDLKTPLTVILSNADILCKNTDCTVSEMSKWILGTKQAATNMKQLIEQMLVLSESETKKETALSKVDFSDIAEQSALVMESVAYEKNIGYTSDIQPDIHINANPEYIKRIVSSLIDNALKYEPSGGNIEITLTSSGKNAVFTVANKSAVIAEADISHIFERFYRSDKSRRTDGSHGLGLAIVKNLTEAMNGKITAASTEKNGTKFSVSFPMQ